MKVVYEDNHIIIVYKESGEIVQGDKTGDVPLSETVKEYIKEKYHKPGNVFLGVVHRLDRPVSGLVLFARTSKALPRLNKMFQTREVKKTYWAVVSKMENGKGRVGISRGNLETRRTENVEDGGLRPQNVGDGGLRPQNVGDGLGIEDGFVRLENWLVRNEKQNKSYCYDREVPNSKKAVLDYKVISRGDRYDLVEVHLHTGRHHQIRCQLAHAGLTIKGDLKYGAARSNPDGSISLLSRSLELVHPVSKELIKVVSPLPYDKLWQALEPKI